VTKPEAYTKELEKAGVVYGLGSKVPHLGCDLVDIEKIDCSGFVRDCLYRTLGRPADFDLPDGSVQQHEYFESHGFKRSTPADALNKDGIFRIAFLDPKDGGGIGHVLLIFKGFTFESHAHHGPGSRRWMSEPKWMSLMQIYVVSRV